MLKTKGRMMVLVVAWLFALALLALALPALALSGDYGIATGSSSCGGSGPPCAITYNGHPASFSATNSDGTVSYTFDNLTCVAVVASNGWITLNGSQCSSVLATATPTS